MYKFLSEDDKAFTLEKNGKKFKVAKKAVSEKFHDQVRNYAFGTTDGPVEAEPEFSDPVQAQAHKEIFQQESSGGKNTKTSNHGAVGQYQIMPATFEGLKKNKEIPQDFDIKNPKHNEIASKALVSEIGNYPKVAAIKDPAKRLEAIKSIYYSGPASVDDNGNLIERTDKLNPNNPTSIEYAKAQPIGERNLGAQKPALQNDIPFWQREQGGDFTPEYIAKNPALQFDPKAQIPFQEPASLSQAMGPGFNIPNPFSSPALDAVGPASGLMAAYKKYGPQPTQSAPAEVPQQAEQAPIEQSAPQQQQQSQITELPKDYQDYLNSTQDALKSSVDAETGLANQKADIYKQQQQQLADAQVKQQQFFDEANKAMENYVESAKNQKIDQNRIFANKSTGDKIMGAIGLMLSGLGSGLTGQPNLALKVINDAIDKDIEVQKLNMDKDQNLLKIQLQKYGNMNSALLASQAIMGTQALAKVAEAAERAKSPQLQAYMKSVMAEKKLDVLNKLTALNTAVSSFKAQTGLGGGMQPGGADHWRALQSDPKMAVRQFFDNRNPKEPQVLFAASEGEATTARSFKDASDKAIRSIDKLENYSLQGKLPASKERQLLLQDWQRAIQSYTSLESAGIDSKRLTELERDLAEKIVANPTAYNINWAKARLKELKLDIIRDRDSRLQTLVPGYRPEPLPTSKPVFER